MRQFGKIRFALQNVFSDRQDLASGAFGSRVSPASRSANCICFADEPREADRGFVELDEQHIRLHVLSVSGVSEATQTAQNIGSAETVIVAG